MQIGKQEMKFQKIKLLMFKKKNPRKANVNF